MSEAANSVSSVCAFASFIFFIVGSVGYTDNKDTIQDVPWIIGSQDITGGDVFIGLRLYYNSGLLKTTVKFSDNECILNFCDKCDRDGRIALGLTIIALFFTFAELAACCIFTGKTTVSSHLLQMALSLVAAIFSLAALILFMGDCYDAIDNTDGFDVHWGTSAILVILGMLLMWLALILHVYGSIVASRGA